MHDIKQLIVELLDSYESKVESIRFLIDTAYRAVRDANTDLTAAFREREEVSTRLKEILAKNCSLRKKDFDAMMDDVMQLLESKRVELEIEQKRLEEILKDYLSRERVRLALMRNKVLEADEKNLYPVLKEIRDEMENEADCILGTFMDMEQRLRTFNKAIKGLNQKLKNLLKKGELLRTEDVKNLRLTEKILLDRLLRDRGRNQHAVYETGENT